MGQYQTTRNIEASLIDYLQTEIDKSWSDVSVIVGFEQAYSQDMPIVALFAQDTIYNPIEVGNTDRKRTVAINLNVFATGDGQKLDLKDYIIKKLFAGCPYYKYTITAGAITAQVATGRIDVVDLSDNPVVFADYATNDAHDKHRHVITLTVELTSYEEA